MVQHIVLILLLGVFASVKSHDDDIHLDMMYDDLFGDEVNFPPLIPMSQMTGNGSLERVKLREDLLSSRHLPTTEKRRKILRRYHRRRLMREKLNGFNVNGADGSSLNANSSGDSSVKTDNSGDSSVGANDSVDSSGMPILTSDNDKLRDISIDGASVIDVESQNYAHPPRDNGVPNTRVPLEKYSYNQSDVIVPNDSEHYSVPARLNRPASTSEFNNRNQLLPSRTNRISPDGRSRHTDQYFG